MLNGKIGSDFLGVSGRLPTGSTRIWMDWDRRTVIGEQSVASIPFIKSAFKQASEKELFVLLFGVGRSSFFWILQELATNHELSLIWQEEMNLTTCIEMFLKLTTAMRNETENPSLEVLVLVFMLSIHDRFAIFCSCLLSPMLNKP